MAHDRFGAGRRVGSALQWWLVLLLMLAAQALAAPREPIERLQAGLALKPDEAALIRLVASCFDLRRMARDMLAGIPEADAGAEARLAAALDARLRRELRRRPPLPPDSRWLEDRPLGPGQWLVLMRTPDPRGEPVIVGWRIADGAAGLRIIDVMRDGVSGVRAQRAALASAIVRDGLDAALAAEEAAALRDPTP